MKKENKIEEIEPEKSNTPEEKDSGKVDVPKVEEVFKTHCLLPLEIKL